jgi:hypothetical protein
MASVTPHRGHPVLQPPLNGAQWPRNNPAADGEITPVRHGQPVHRGLGLSKNRVQRRMTFMQPGTRLSPAGLVRHADAN